VAAVLLALGSSLSFGIADFFGGVVTRRHAVVVVLLVSQTVGLAGIALVVLVRDAVAVLVLVVADLGVAREVVRVAVVAVVAGLGPMSPGRVAAGVGDRLDAERAKSGHGEPAAAE